MKKFILVIAAVGFIALIGGLIVLGRTGSGFHFSGGEVTLKDSKTSAISNVERIEVETVSERVNLVKTADTSLKADLRVGNRDSDVNLVVLASADGKVLTVRAERNHKLSFFDTSWGGDLDVSIPESYTGDLSVTTTSGSIQGDGLPQINNFRAESTSGGIELSNFSGVDGLNLKTISGRISAENLAGFKSIEAHSTSGRVGLSRLTGNLNASTISGRIDLLFDNLQNEVRAKSTSGRVVIDLPASANATFTFETVSGGLSNRNNLNLTRETRTYYEGKVGNGGTKIDVETVSGGLSIE